MLTHGDHLSCSDGMLQVVGQLPASLKPTTCLPRVSFPQYELIQYKANIMEGLAISMVIIFLRAWTMP